MLSRQGHFIEPECNMKETSGKVFHLNDDYPRDIPEGKEYMAN